MGDAHVIRVRDSSVVAAVGGVWIDYAPTLTQSGAVAYIPEIGTSGGRYRRDGSTIHWEVSIVITGNGASGVDIQVGLPQPYLYSVGNAGCGMFYDASIAFRTVFVCERKGGAQSFYISQTGSGGLLGLAPTTALALNDVIRASGTYEMT